MANAKPGLKKSFDELIFAANQVLEAFDYGQTVVEIEDAVDNLRQTLHDIEQLHG